MKIDWQALGWLSSFKQQILQVESVCDDSRRLQKGAAFFAYDGVRYMAKDFCFEALQKGAAAVFLDGKYRKSISTHPNFHSGLPIFFSPPVSDANDNTKDSNKETYLFFAAYTMQALLGFPANKLLTVGVTGTNGKTTIANSLYELYAPRSSFLGTIGKKIAELPHEDFGLTTPSAAGVQNFLAQSVLHNVRLATIECSSHGILQGRVAAIPWKFLIFTNLTQDHLDFHHDMESYYLAKKKLFVEAATSADVYKQKFLAESINYENKISEYINKFNREEKGLQTCSIINIDDAYGLRLYNELKTETSLRVYAYGFGNTDENINFRPDFHLQSFSADFNGYRFTLAFPCLAFSKKTSDANKHKKNSLANNEQSVMVHETDDEQTESSAVPQVPVTSRFLGKFQVYNLTAVMAAAVLMDWDLYKRNATSLHELAQKISHLQAAKGRMQVLFKTCPVVVDYAHTPDALQKALETLAEMKPKKIFCVFGCGGERDPKKRPLMGAIAARLAQHIIITNDNPRSEEPSVIAKQILQGACKEANEQNTIEVLLDRKKAIESALEKADSQDIVLVAGKGHEEYQILNEGKILFSDQRIIVEYKP